MPKILLVEDNELNAEMLTRRLERRGFTMLLARCGLDAVAMSLRDRPDLILMDVNLPDIDGLEATRRIKQDNQTAAIPLIALTAHATIGDRDESFGAGCDDYESKPVDLPRLLAKMEALLAKD